MDAVTAPDEPPGVDDVPPVGGRPHRFVATPDVWWPMAVAAAAFAVVVACSWTVVARSAGGGDAGQVGTEIVVAMLVAAAILAVAAFWVAHRSGRGIAPSTGTAVVVVVGTVTSAVWWLVAR